MHCTERRVRFLVCLEVVRPSPMMSNGRSEVPIVLVLSIAVLVLSETVLVLVIEEELC